MDIRVSGHQVDTGDALKVHVEDRLSALADKYFPNAIAAHATFGRGPHDQFKCDIVSHIMHGLVLKASNEASDAHVAFDGASGKIEKQLRRYMRRLHDRHSQSAQAMREEDAAYTVFEGTDDAVEVPDAPLIVVESRVDIPETSVPDAVMMLDLRDTSALLFKNIATGIHNMVYRRPDGTIGWVEPRPAR